jgi:ParB-like chromosome segregation protein Spo0J
MPVQDEEVLEGDLAKLSPDVQALLRQGRKAQRDLETATAARAQMELQVAIDRAGIPDHPAREIVFKDYEGEMNAEAIKAHAEKFGIVAPVKEEGVSTQELDAQRQILNAGGNGTPIGGSDIDLAVAFRNCKSQAEVMAIVAQVARTPGFHNFDGLIGDLPEF